jgi:hypothetical protein
MQRTDWRVKGKDREGGRERKRGERERENSVSIDEPVQLRS